MIFEKTAEIYKGGYLECYLHENYDEIGIKERPGIIICPGGAYAFLSDREGEPIALKYLASGFNVFVLRYSVGEKARDFTPLCQALLSIRHLRENAGKYALKKDRIFISGFSAGGHLAASAGTMFDIPEIENVIGSDRQSVRPDGMILCYPVITGGEKTHEGSIKNVIGKSEPTSEEREYFSCERHVSEKTPPAFLWHTANDPVVPVENTLLFAAALSAKKVPFEVHIYPSGNHGLALANYETCSGYESHKNPYVEGWIDRAVKWALSFPEFK